jgi:hypothetical protein
MNILAILLSTVELKFIEFLFCILAACSLGYGIGKRKMKNA